MQVVFPLDDLTSCLSGYGVQRSIIPESFEVSVDGTIIPIQEVVSDHPYKNQTGGACNTMTWEGFNVTLPTAQNVLIKINYTMNITRNVIEYTLETGAGWKGPIDRAYIIVRFPYAITDENILASSNPNYQILYNEIYWSFQSLEPTAIDNISLTYVDTSIWQEIIKWRNTVKENPQSPEGWLHLIDNYRSASSTGVKFEYNPKYYSKIEPT